MRGKPSFVASTSPVSEVGPAFPLSFIVAFKHNSQVDLDLSPFCVTSLISDHIPGFQEKHTLKHFYDKRLEGDMVVSFDFRLKITAAVHGALEEPDFSGEFSQ